MAFPWSSDDENKAFVRVDERCVQSSGVRYGRLTANFRLEWLVVSTRKSPNL